YSPGRQAVARELIDFDRAWAGMLSAPLRSERNPGGGGPAAVPTHFVRHGRYTAAAATPSKPSTHTGAGSHQHLAEGLTIGMRFHSAPATRLADAKPLHLGHTVKADGRWRLFAFAGAHDSAGPSSGIRRLCDFLAGSAESP